VLPSISLSTRPRVVAPRKERDPDQYRDIAGHQQVETGQQQQQQKVNMSADNYLMQEELGSTF
jgi:hypothetical protein